MGNFRFASTDVEPGFTLNRLTGKFETSDLKLVAGLRDKLDDDAKRTFSNCSFEKSFWPGGTLHPPSQKLDPVQMLGVRWAMTRNHSYLAFEPGLGKTATAICIHNSIENCKTLIIVPPFLISNWIREIKDWHFGDDISINTIVAGSGYYCADRPITICADSLLIRDQVQNLLKAEKFDLVIVDEAQRFVNIDAKRTRALFGDYISTGIIHAGAKKVLLSGTPMKRGPIDLFAPLKALAWNNINYADYFTYGKRFCAGFEKQVTRNKRVWDFSGSSNIVELTDRLRPFMRVETLKEHLPDLEKTERIILLDGDTKKILKLEKDLLTKKSLDDLISNKNVDAISKYRKELSKVKVPIALEYLEDFLEDTNEPFLIFGVHVETLELMAEKLKKYKVGLIIGKVKNDDRARLEEDFRRGKLRGIIANIQTMVGQNFQRAKRALFIESSWTPDDNAQAGHRIFRRGQLNAVLIQHLVMANTLDEYVLKKVLNKQKNINSVLTNQQRKIV